MNAWQQRLENAELAAAEARAKVWEVAWIARLKSKDWQIQRFDSVWPRNPKIMLSKYARQVYRYW